MSRILLNTLLATAVIASIAGAASAAPVSSIAVIHGPAYPAPTRSLVQPVHWEHPPWSPGLGVRPPPLPPLGRTGPASHPSGWGSGYSGRIVVSPQSSTLNLGGNACPGRRLA